jgi:hypothetical protein
VTTTDFSTGALSIIDVDDRCVQPDVALASTDAVPVVDDDSVYVLNRFMFDYVDLLEADKEWRLAGEMAIESEGATSTNPHDLVVDDDGLAYVALYGAPEVQILDVAAEQVAGRISIEAFADEDGVPEANLMTIHDGELFVIVEHLDRANGWVRVADDEAVVIDLESRQLVDVDPETDGVQAVALPGTWSKQLRPVPGQPGSRLVLSSGIYRMDLEARTTQWVIDESQMAQVGLADPDLPLSFDVSDDGQTLFIAAYDEGWEQARIYSASTQGGALEQIVTGVNAVERSLEVVGDEIWFGDTTSDRAGMQAYDFDGNPLLDEPLVTGLAPYAVAAMP